MLSYALIGSAGRAAEKPRISTSMTLRVKVRLHSRLHIRAVRFYQRRQLQIRHIGT